MEAEAALRHFGGDLEAMVRELWDREQIAQVPLLYGRGLDNGDWDLVRSCFTEDALIEGSKDTLPVAEVVARSERLAGRYVVNRHVIGNQLVEVDGDRGRVDSYVVAYHWIREPAGADDPANLIAGGQYNDTMVRQGDRWVIAHRRVERYWNVGQQPM